MALSGSVSTKFYNDNFTVYFDWSATQSTSNNRSTVTVKMYLKSNGSMFLSGGASSCKCAIKLDGTWYDSTSFNGSLSPSDGKVLKYTFPGVNLTHSSTGTKSFSLLGEVAFTNTNVISGSSNLGSVGYKFTTSSKTFTLNTIARASTLDSFSISSHLKPSTANTVNLSITRKSSSYTHDIELRDGSTVLKTWTGQGTPSTLTIDSGTVNTLLSRMSSATSRTLTLRVQTKSGSSNIGSAVTRTATATVDSSVKPTATGLKVSVYGSGRDNTIGKFVQGISRVTSSFTGTAIGGASVSSRKIVIRRDSDDSNSQTISSGSGTTSGKVTLSGTYEAIATVTDTRGRSTTQRITFTVYAYSPPKITSFTAVRNSSTPTTVNIGRYGSWTTLGGDNTLAIVVKRGSTTIQSVTGTGTSGSVSGTLNDTGRSVTSSYTYTVTLTDTFGNSASASASVSTQKVVLDIHKNEGVGIGKIHEKGALDVGGVAWFEEFGTHVLPSNTNLNDVTKTGFYRNNSNAQVATMTNTPTNTAFSMIVTNHAGVSQLWFDYNTPTKVYHRNYYQGTWKAWSQFSFDGHNHSGANITSGTVPYARLPVGTGSSQVASGNHTHSYLPLSGGTTTGTTALAGGRLRVYASGSAEVRIDNNAGSYTDVTLRPSITDRGNCGSGSYYWNNAYSKRWQLPSVRSMKENIQPYDEDYAYEQLKDIPIYTYSFKEGQFTDHNIGTMIDYMPIEIVDTTRIGRTQEDEVGMWATGSALYFNMAVTKVLQRKVETLEDKVEDLQSKYDDLLERLSKLEGNV